MAEGGGGEVLAVHQHEMKMCSIEENRVSTDGTLQYMANIARWVSGRIHRGTNMILKIYIFYSKIRGVRSTLCTLNIQIFGQC
jgi:hypothetical protein